MLRLLLPLLPLLLGLEQAGATAQTAAAVQTGHALGRLFLPPLPLLLPLRLPLRQPLLLSWPVQGRFPLGLLLLACGLAGQPAEPPARQSAAAAPRW